MWPHYCIAGATIDPFIRRCRVHLYSWWRHQMETFSALLDLCAGNSPVTGEFHAQRPVTRSFEFFFDLHLNKRLSKQWWGWWFETPTRPLWRHCNVFTRNKSWDKWPRGIFGKWPRVGDTKPISPVPGDYFPSFSALGIYVLAIEYHVYIWQVSPQLSCCDTCQIWM